MARSLTVISLLLQSTTHCCYRVYTKFLLTYTAIYQGKSQSSTAGNNGAPTSVPLSLGHALYITFEGEGPKFSNTIAGALA